MPVYPITVIIGVCLGLFFGIKRAIKDAKEETAETKKLEERFGIKL